MPEFSSCFERVKQSCGTSVYPESSTSPALKSNFPKGVGALKTFSALNVALISLAFFPVSVDLQIWKTVKMYLCLRWFRTDSQLNHHTALTPSPLRKTGVRKYDRKKKAHWLR